MCLEHLVNVDLPMGSEENPLVGYKAVPVYELNDESHILKYVKGDTIQNHLYAFLYNGYYELYKWLVAINRLTTTHRNESYYSGFHVFENIEDAKNFKNDYLKIVKVHFYDVKYVGKQFPSDIGVTFVANKMKIVEIIKE